MVRIVISSMFTQGLVSEVPRRNYLLKKEMISKDRAWNDANR